jgi:release factor glutamine methyltransferase
MTVRDAQVRATRELERSPDLQARAGLDAALLLRHTLGLSAAQVWARPERVLTAEEQAAYKAAIARRTAHEPVQYITGEQEFYGLALHVTPAVLIPRPETELLVEAVLAELHSPSVDPIRIVDVGTGSGAIALALAAHLPHAEITAVDLSRAALEVASENATRHQLTRVRLLESDLLSGVEGEALFDVVVSNPPYVADGDRLTLHHEVRKYEPASALFAGATGMDVYRRLIPQARTRMRPGGLLAMEFGFGQQELLLQLLAEWNHVRFFNDLQGIPRVVLARS